MAADSRLERIKPGVLTLLVGPTAVGKTSVLEGVLQKYPDSKRVVSTTSRPRSPSEVNGREYSFIHPFMFNVYSKFGGFLETGPYGGYWYGTRKKDITPVLVGQDLVWIVAMYRGLEIENYYKKSYSPRIAKDLLERTLLVMIGTPSLFDLRRRFRIRKRDGDFLIRMRQDWDTWRTNRDMFTHVVVNREGHLDETVRGVSELIEQRRAKLQRLIE